MELVSGRQIILCFSSFEEEEKQVSISTEVEMIPLAMAESPFYCSSSICNIYLWDILLCVDVERSPALLRNLVLKCSKEVRRVYW